MLGPQHSVFVFLVFNSNLTETDRVYIWGTKWVLHSKAFIEFSNWDQDLPHPHEIVKKGKTWISVHFQFHRKLGRDVVVAVTLFFKVKVSFASLSNPPGNEIFWCKVEKMWAHLRFLCWDLERRDNLVFD